MVLDLYQCIAADRKQSYISEGSGKFHRTSGDMGICDSGNRRRVVRGHRYDVFDTS